MTRRGRADDGRRAARATGTCCAGHARRAPAARSSASAASPGAETCDGVDNDCDGTTDEGNPRRRATCLSAPYRRLRSAPCDLQRRRARGGRRDTVGASVLRRRPGLRRELTRAAHGDPGAAASVGTCVGPCSTDAPAAPWCATVGRPLRDRRLQRLPTAAPPTSCAIAGHLRHQRLRGGGPPERRVLSRGACVSRPGRRELPGSTTTATARARATRRRRRVRRRPASAPRPLHLRGGACAAAAAGPGGGERATRSTTTATRVTVRGQRPAAAQRAARAGDVLRPGDMTRRGGRQRSPAPARAARALRSCRAWTTTTMAAAEAGSRCCWAWRCSWLVGGARDPRRRRRGAVRRPGARAARGRLRRERVLRDLRRRNGDGGPVLRADAAPGVGDGGSGNGDGGLADAAPPRRRLRGRRRRRSATRSTTTATARSTRAPVAQAATSCGTDVGACSKGTLACTAGDLVCAGARSMPPGRDLQRRGRRLRRHRSTRATPAAAGVR